ncbi:hypothetical protein COB64_03760 [Candidatus Wolfebacteria bacterium]|nr:MAG: hypothetical protein COB64_03760 [Candidatus Wolfebacteria bacterium]
MRVIVIAVILLSLHFRLLAQNEPTVTIAPDPFVDTTTITFSLSFSDTVSLIVYNQFGELIDSILNEQLMPAGTQSIQFIGDTLPIGKYFAHLDVDTHLIVTQFIKIGQLTLGEVRYGLEQLNINIFPNPTTGLITITNLPQEITKIAVYNVLGELVLNQELIESNKALIHLDDLPNGVYFLQVSNGENAMSVKVIKQD